MLPLPAIKVASAGARQTNAQANFTGAQSRIDADSNSGPRQLNTAAPADRTPWPGEDSLPAGTWQQSQQAVSSAAAQVSDAPTEGEAADLASQRTEAGLASEADARVEGLLAPLSSLQASINPVALGRPAAALGDDPGVVLAAMPPVHQPDQAQLTASSPLFGGALLTDASGQATVLATALASAAVTADAVGAPAVPASALNQQTPYQAARYAAAFYQHSGTSAGLAAGSVSGSVSGLPSVGAGDMTSAPPLAAPPPLVQASSDASRQAVQGGAAGNSLLTGSSAVSGSGALAQAALNSPAFAGRLQAHEQAQSSLTASADPGLALAGSTGSAKTLPVWQSAALNPQSPQFAQQLWQLLGDKAELQLGLQVKKALVRLDPPSLGSIELAVSLDGDRLNVQVHSSNGLLRDAMAQGLEQLRASLAQRLGSELQVDVQLTDARQQADQQAGRQQTAQQTGVAPAANWQQAAEQTQAGPTDAPLAGSLAQHFVNQLV